MGDIKSSNLMRFKCEHKVVWKLIDMDGMVPTQTAIDPSTISFTPLYCAPEIAAVVTRGESQVVVSQSMDVWPLGICLLDCVLPGPLFSAEFQKRGRNEFLSWLSTIEEVCLPPALFNF